MTTPQPCPDCNLVHSDSPDRVDRFERFERLCAEALADLVREKGQSQALFLAGKQMAHLHLEYSIVHTYLTSILARVERIEPHAPPGALMEVTAMSGDVLMALNALAHITKPMLQGFTTKTFTAPAPPASIIAAGFQRLTPHGG